MAADLKNKPQKGFETFLLFAWKAFKKLSANRYNYFYPNFWL
jgi:hypothetical protein